MYMRVTRGHLAPSLTEEYVRVVGESTIPALQQMAGFRGVHAGADRESGALLSVSLWDTLEQAMAVDVIRPQLEALGVQFAAPELYEVHAQG